MTTGDVLNPGHLPPCPGCGLPDDACRHRPTECSYWAALDAITRDDEQWFHRHPHRTTRIRPATAEEQIWELRRGGPIIGPLVEVTCDTWTDDRGVPQMWTWVEHSPSDELDLSRRPHPPATRT